MSLHSQFQLICPDTKTALELLSSVCLTRLVGHRSLAFRKLTDTTAERSRYRRVVYHSTAILTAKHPFGRKFGQRKGQR